MPQGICIVVEHHDGRISPAFAELVSAAKGIGEATGTPVQAMIAAESSERIIDQIKSYPLDEIYAVDIGRDMAFHDDSLSTVYADMLSQIDPAGVLIAASEMGRSVFPRVAYRLKAGLTADCTEIAAAFQPDGSWYIRQTKPSFEAMAMVDLRCKPDVYPQMMTIREGVYESFSDTGDDGASVQEQGAGTAPKIFLLKIDPPMDSGIEVIDIVPRETAPGSIRGAEIVFGAGRGALEGDNFDLLRDVAKKIGAAVGGTRPLIDQDAIPFENQIGQTGSTIRPRILISFGASGAIQHTEGIKNTKLFIAVNTDADAPIFRLADYGAVMDMKPVLECMRDLLATDY